VIVEDGIAYVAAGIVNYDGTHVYALDAETGSIKWQNNSSGHLEPEFRTGVSVQGHMLVNGGNLYLAGGTAVSPAVYDLDTGTCLNESGHLRRAESDSPRGWELSLVGDKVVAYGKPLYIHPEHAVYDDTVSEKILVASAGDLDIVWTDNSQVQCFSPPLEISALNRCVFEQGPIIKSRLRPWGAFKPGRKPVWKHDAHDGRAVALAENAVVMATKSEITALDLNDGSVRWTRPLPAGPVPWGLAVDREGRAIVTLEDGQILCFGANRSG
jgi:outer membrane protein assembly factor BamB